METIGITISTEQYNYAISTYANTGVEYYLKDHRKLSAGTMGTFDDIYSIGQFEHVTSEHYSEFMVICDGLFLLHTIDSNTFLDKYIFPNSMLPSLAQISLYY